MSDVSGVTALIEETAAPTDHQVETMDARELPPPEPLQNTLERLVELDEETVLVQYNDRAPQHLYSHLTDRGYAYKTVETDTCTVTVIWTDG